MSIEFIECICNGAKLAFRLRSRVKKYNLIVASYDIVRKDIGFFSRIKWNYCILDEGHVIKNGKTKVNKFVSLITGFCDQFMLHY